MRNHASHPRPSRPRCGVVLVAVLVVVAILMLVGYQFHRLMNAEHEATYASNHVAQCRHLADSGLHQTALLLSHPYLAGISDAPDSAVVFPGAVYDNPALFHLQPVRSPHGGYPLGYFSVIALRDPEDPLYGQVPRFGVEDEGAKINVNALLQLDRSGQRAREVLMKLPGVTESQVNSLLNWMRPAGSSTSDDSLYYASLGYAPKGGPYESLEEMLLVRDITPRVLLGNDRNRNGILEPEEDDLSGFLDPGLMRYLTVYSRELNVDAQGMPRIWVNNPDLVTLHEQLVAAVGEDLANFIVAYRLYPPPNNTVRFMTFAADGTNLTVAGEAAVRLSVSGNDLTVVQGEALSDYLIQLAQAQDVQVGELVQEDLDFSRKPARNIGSLFELIDASVQFTRPEEREPTRFLSPLQRGDLDTLREVLPVVLDKLTTSQQRELTPRVNINTAPPEVILAFPNLTEADVQVILDLRPAPDSDLAQAPLYRTPAWLITEAGFEPSAVRQFEPYFTTRSQVFRVQVVGYYERGGPVVRLEAVIDTNNGRPRFLYWRDLSELGRGSNPRLFGGTVLLP